MFRLFLLNCTFENVHGNTLLLLFPVEMFFWSELGHIILQRMHAGAHTGELEGWVRVLMLADSSVWGGCSLWYWDMRSLKAHKQRNKHLPAHQRKRKLKLYRHAFTLTQCVSWTASPRQTGCDGWSLLQTESVCIYIRHQCCETLHSVGALKWFLSFSMEPDVSYIVCMWMAPC